jgi:hypothetical protein
MSRLKAVTYKAEELAVRWRTKGKGGVAPCVAGWGVTSFWQIGTQAGLPVLLKSDTKREERFLHYATRHRFAVERRRRAASVGMT